MTTAADFGQALGLALQTITKSIAPCEYQVTPEAGTVINPDKVNVVYSDVSGAEPQKYGVITNQTLDPSDCSLGWRYTDSTGTTIQLCRGTCDYIGNNPFAQVQVLLGCTSIVKVE